MRAVQFLTLSFHHSFQDVDVNKQNFFFWENESKKINCVASVEECKNLYE